MPYPLGPIINGSVPPRVSILKFRVGAPTLHPLPLKCTWDDVCATLDKYFGDRFVEKAREVLSRNNILYRKVELTSRTIHGESSKSNARPIIFIVADWSDSARYVWPRIVLAVKEYVDSEIAKNTQLSHISVHVEMVAPELTMRKYLSPVPNDKTLPGLERDWPMIKTRVREMLESAPATSSHITAICLFRLGYDPHHTENPKTVYVSVDYESNEEGWAVLVDRIQAYLNTLRHDLHFHIEHNAMNRFAFPLVALDLDDYERKDREQRFNFDIRRRYEEKVNLGEDICAAQYILRDDNRKCCPTTGTLGCYLGIKSKRYPTWTTMALTNYHIVRPTIKGFELGTKPKAATPTTTSSGTRSKLKPPRKGTDLWNADLKGITPSTAATRAPIEHPARAKHNFAIEGLRAARKAQGQNSDDDDEATLAWLAGLDAELATKLAFFDRGMNKFGTVYAGSGYNRRTPTTNHRLDWALVEPLGNRVGGNVLPDERAWKGKTALELMPLVATFGKTLRAPPPEGEGSLGELTPEDLVYKVGASTGATVGVFSKVKNDCSVAEDRYVGRGFSEEYVFIGRCNANVNSDVRFADIGDSGAVVFDKRGRALGVVFTGQTPQQAGSDGYCFVTPIEDVFRDIKEFSKGDITDIRIAGT
ncbi:hypothetical protein QBC33DRAFT_551924 [Phialemonium atrogriseum]|uniref:Peptidase S7 domain-containing protein n=1 Tax=Phialemonium atrogriseum TaxID=1093897 RepID=A0AAJ0BQ76_9PEZI|nr:uncharacterized protein QBC33DRAFT_551924 [Phialemonium atrogriseum]KAK1762459.1 hypothetical protein QBC33DRAFT_551924 [Phialemonium atrogriseum]